MIAIETNILVYAHRPEMPSHNAAKVVITDLVASGQRYGIPIHCIVEFAGVVSNRRIWKEPSSARQIETQVGAWLEPPSAWALTEEPEFVTALMSILTASGVGGGGVHDARIAACCMFHGVRELWTADRDFGRFPSLSTRNPLVGQG